MIVLIIVKLSRQRKTSEELIKKQDFDFVIQDLIKRKDEWFNLEFFDQSDWKCNYFGVPSERYKMVIWQ